MDEFSRRRAAHDAKPCETCTLYDKWLADGFDPDTYEAEWEWRGRPGSVRWQVKSEGGLWTEAVIAHARFFRGTKRGPPEGEPRG